jgi:hypothetical protein
MEYLINVRRASCDVWQPHEANDHVALVELIDYFLELGYFIEVQLKQAGEV